MNDEDHDAPPNKLWWLFPVFVFLGVFGTGVGVCSGLSFLFNMPGK